MDINTFRTTLITAFVATLLSCAPTAHAQQVQCQMTLAFNQADKSVPGGTTPVWTDAAGNLMFVEHLNVNTDGTRRSYSVSDFWGETTALNNLCNAMSDACAGLGNDALKRRRIATQQAERAGWPRGQLAATKLSKQIIPMPGGKPCPPVKGYLVSATALHKPSIADVCEISNYVDALTVPAIVIPKNPRGGQSEFTKRNVKVGDLVAAIAIDADIKVLGVVGDTGPINELGEASIAMNGKLLGKTDPPANYREVRGKRPYEGKSWNSPKTFVLIFKQSRNTQSPYMTTDRIEPEAATRFEAWGGNARAKACISEVRLSGSVE